MSEKSEIGKDETKHRHRGDAASGKAPLKGKAPVKRSSPANPEETTPKTQVSTPAPQAGNGENSILMECLKSIQSNQTALLKRIETIEKSYEDYECQDFDSYERPYEHAYDYEMDCEEEGSSQSAPNLQKIEDESENTSRFSRLSKRFKAVDVSGEDVDSVLAGTLTDLFRKGMDPEQYEFLVKDENTPRPGNCEGLVVVKMNKLIWDVISPVARTNDRKLQNCETAIVKSAIIMANTVDKIAKLEQVFQDGGQTENAKEMGALVDSCNDALSLLGHANFQTNMARRDFLKPELKREYGHLCTHSIPYTSELFGDDVSKTAKEIEDCAKLGHRLQTGYKIPFKNRAFPRGGRFRGRGMVPRGRGYHPYAGSSSSYSGSRQLDERKNGPRRGGSTFRSTKN